MLTLINLIHRLVTWFSGLIMSYRTTLLWKQLLQEVRLSHCWPDKIVPGFTMICVWLIRTFLTVKWNWREWDFFKRTLWGLPIKRLPPGWWHAIPTNSKPEPNSKRILSQPQLTPNIGRFKVLAKQQRTIKHQSVGFEYIAWLHCVYFRPCKGKICTHIHGQVYGWQKQHWLEIT